MTLALLRPIASLGRGELPAEPILPPEARAGIVALEADLALLDETLVPAFERLDAVALRAQRSYRRLRLVLIVGTTLATILGAWQAAVRHSALPGTLEAVVGAFVAGSTALLHARGYHRCYLTARLAAERLRAEYFLFLARAGSYAGADEQAKRRLADQVDEIEAGGEV